MKFKLGELIDISHGYAFKGEFFSDEHTHLILLTPGNVKVGGGFSFQKRKYYSEQGPLDEKYVFKSGDMFVTMTDLSKVGDTLGFPAIVPDIGEYKFLHNQRLGRIIIKNENI